MAQSVRQVQRAIQEQLVQRAIQEQLVLRAQLVLQVQMA